jgi:hypothetical protein
MSFSLDVRNLGIHSDIDTLERLNKALDQSRVHVSLWGKMRIIYQKELARRESVRLDVLAQKVDIASIDCREKGLDELRREQWILVSQKITRFYDNVAEVISRSLCIQPFNVINIRCCLSPTLDIQDSFSIENNADSSVELNFRLYSKEALEELKTSMMLADIEQVDSKDGSSPCYYVTVETIHRKASMARLIN